MFIIASLLILFILSFKLLSNYIKKIRTGDPNESDITYWMFSYDFRSPNKDWVPEDQNLLKRKRARNALVFVLYIIVFIIFLLMNSFAAHVLDTIVNQKFTYPV
tara:strand:+ start:387 stop:698 length:312 start_codon:yes stop_codon:yes gene_type:complete